MHDSLRPFSFFSSGGHFVKPKGTILAILVKGHKRNISVKLFRNPVIGLRGFLFKGFSILALVAILFSGAEPF